MSILAALSGFGVTSYVIWEFAVGVLSVMFVAALVLMGVTFIQRLIK